MVEGEYAWDVRFCRRGAEEQRGQRWILLRTKVTADEAGTWGVEWVGFGERGWCRCGMRCLAVWRSFPEPVENRRSQYRAAAQSWDDPGLAAKLSASWR